MNFEQLKEEISKTTLKFKENDSLDLACRITKQTPERLIEVLLMNLLPERLIDGDEYGISLFKLAELNSIEIEEFINIAFPNIKNTFEFKEISKNLIFFNSEDFSENCPECGCELEVENQSEGKHEWKDKKCTNPHQFCDFKDTDCPDFDTLPGGYDRR